MTAAIVAFIAMAAVFGGALGIRHLYLRLDRPGGCTSSMRIISGNAPGLSATFRTGYTGPELDQLWWRRLFMPGAGVKFAKSSVTLAGARRPRGRELLVVPARFTILVVVLADGTRLELAIPPRHIQRVVATHDLPPTAR